MKVIHAQNLQDGVIRITRDDRGVFLELTAGGEGVEAFVTPADLNVLKNAILRKQGEIRHDRA